MQEWVERYRPVIALILIFITISGAAVFLARRPDSRPVEIITPTRVPKATAQPIKVYVTGEVANPGVYTLRENDRIEDAIRTAGGATVDADLIKVNLAAKVFDQLQVYVPKKADDTSREVSAPTINAPSKININTATASELDSLPGIGSVTTQRIIAHRQEHGPFKSIEGLKEAKLVSGSTFEKIKDLIVAR